jgi:hypothetical protein
MQCSTQALATPPGNFPFNPYQFLGLSYSNHQRRTKPRKRHQAWQSRRDIFRTLERPILLELLQKH